MEIFFIPFIIACGYIFGIFKLTEYFRNKYYQEMTTKKMLIVNVIALLSFLALHFLYFYKLILFYALFFIPQLLFIMISIIILLITNQIITKGKKGSVLMSLLFFLPIALPWSLIWFIVIWVKFNAGT